MWLHNIEILSEKLLYLQNRDLYKSGLIVYRLIEHGEREKNRNGSKREDPVELYIIRNDEAMCFSLFSFRLSDSSFFTFFFFFCGIQFSSRTWSECYIFYYSIRALAVYTYGLRSYVGNFFFFLCIQPYIFFERNLRAARKEGISIFFKSSYALVIKFVEYSYRRTRRMCRNTTTGVIFRRNRTVFEVRRIFYTNIG